MDPHWGRLQVRKVSFRDYREDPAILRPTGGAAPRSREKLALQARQVFRSLDEIVLDLPRLPGLWIRSPGALAGRRGFPNTTRNQPFANTYIWLQYGCFGCIWNQLHRSEVVDKWLETVQ
jgi:hypothetical protein